MRCRIALASMLLAAAGCTGEPGDRADEDAMADPLDGGPAEHRDAGGGTGLDAGAPPAADGGGDPGAPDGLQATPDNARGELGYDASEGDFDGASRSGGDATACYDNVDADDEGGIDCGDASCHVLRSCCVGSGDCCAGPQVLAGGAIDLSDGSTCADAGETPAASCLPDAGYDVEAFGFPAPFVADGGLYPNGDSEGDSGLMLGEPVDLRTHRVTIEAELNEATGCGASCLEGVAVGLTTRTDLADAGESARVQTMVGLTLSSSSGRVSLVVRDEVVASRRHAPGRWKLVARPNGRVTAQAPAGTEIADMQARVVPEAGARVLMWGRNRNTTETRAHVSYLSAHSSLCDNPSAWPERRAIVLRPESGTEPPAFGGADNPSLARGPEGSTWLAFDAPTGEGESRAIHLGERTADADPESFALRPPEGEAAGVPALASGGMHDAGGMRDPELVWMGGEGHVLLYTAVDGEGVLTIGRAVRAEPSAEWTVDTEPVLAPEDDAVAVSQPAVARREDGAHWIMVADVELSTGAHELRLYHSSDASEGGSWSRDFHGTELDRLVRAPDQRAPAYDADAIGAVSLAIHDGAWQLYYARRRGTRWSVGLVASHELIYWRHVDGGAAVLSQGPSDFDRLGLRSPGAVGYSKTVEVAYVGLDGTDGGLGIARRSAAPMGEFPP